MRKKFEKVILGEENMFDRSHCKPRCSDDRVCTLNAIRVATLNNDDDDDDYDDDDDDCNMMMTTLATTTTMMMMVKMIIIIIYGDICGCRPLN